MSSKNAGKEKTNNPKTKNEGGSNLGYFRQVNIISVISVLFLIISILYVSINRKQCDDSHSGAHARPEQVSIRKFKVFGKNALSGHLHNVFSVLDKFGLKFDSNSTDWDLLWAHDYPFRVLFNELRHLKENQKINHFPGCGHITNKVDLATSGLKYIPPAFKLPEDKEKLLKYVQGNPDSTFVEKNNDHRNILFRTKDELLELESNSTFVQEFVSNPLLVNGHKFDIGIYTVITSVDPLRVYIYNGDALLRFCPVKYHPFDAQNLDKYVVGDDYLPVWRMPSLEYYYNELGFGMRESLNAYLRSKGKDPSRIWIQIEESLRTTILAKEHLILNAMNKFKFKRNFFEMMRFDFLVDEDLNVFLLEANMSPNLSSAHFPPNQLLYHQVLYNILALVGVGSRLGQKTDSKLEQAMVASDKNIAVYPSECNSMMCRESCISPICQLCRPCLSYDTKEYLLEAYREHLDKGDCKRIFPPSMSREGIAQDEDLDGLSPENQLLYRWFKGKCLLDETWC